MLYIFSVRCAFQRWCQALIKCSLLLLRQHNCIASKLTHLKVFKPFPAQPCAFACYVLGADYYLLSADYQDLCWIDLMWFRRPPAIRTSLCLGVRSTLSVILFLSAIASIILFSFFKLLTTFSIVMGVP